MLSQEEIAIIYKKLSPPSHNQEDLINLFNISRRAEQEATSYYNNLSEPKCLNLQLYIKMWVRDLISDKISGKRVTPIKISKDSKSSLGKALYEFWSIIPENLAQDLGIHKQTVPYEEREKLLESKVEKLGIKISDAKTKFSNLITARNKLAKQKGFSSLIEEKLLSSKISQKQFNSFNIHVDRIIEKINESLPDESLLPDKFYEKLNIPCYVCLIENFPSWNKNGLQNLMIGYYPIFEKYINKIDYERGESYSMFYDIRKDRFTIRVNTEDNFRHQALGVLHEMCHIINYLEAFKDGTDPRTVGKLQSEELALTKQLKILNQTSIDLYNAFIGNYLVTLRDTLFEIEMYNDPRKDPSKLYAESFSRCFKKAKIQTINHLYLFSNLFTNKPLASLPHCMAMVNILREP